MVLSRYPLIETYRGHKIPSCPEMFPIELPLLSTKPSRYRNGTLTLEIAHHLRNRILWRYIEANMNMVSHQRPLYNLHPSASG